MNILRKKAPSTRPVVRACLAGSGRSQTVTGGWRERDSRAGARDTGLVTSSKPQSGPG